MSEPLSPGSFPLDFLFGIHNHQPVGNFDGVFEDAALKSYCPFLALLKEFPSIRLSVHTSGTLLKWLQDGAPQYFDLLGALVGRGQVELLTGGFYEPILSVLPDHDKVGQIEALSEFVDRHFGVRPVGMWLAERVWEPHLAKPLAEAGVRYVLLDDSHFELAGLHPDELSGYYLTEEAGREIAIFPISQRIRYLMPFRPPAELLAYLGTRKGAVTCVDDGEKFGVWPGTHRLVYEEGWLRQLLEKLEAADWIRTTTFSEYLSQHPATGTVYLPAASYREMGEWALPPSATQALEDAKDELRGIPRGEEISGWLRGGFWRNFLTKYPEANDAYRKMLRLSGEIHARLREDPESGTLKSAREALWQGQGNDAYWHGVFGGLYLPHLRRAIKGALLSAEEGLRQARGGPGLNWSIGDLDGDGRDELLVTTSTLTLSFRPSAGGSLTECGYRPKRLDLADVLTRRAEAYHRKLKEKVEREGSGEVKTIHEEAGAKEEGLHALLHYDRLRRGMLQEFLLPEDGPLWALAPWENALRVFPELRAALLVSSGPEMVEARFSFDERDSWPLRVKKTVSIEGAGARIHVHYRLLVMGNLPLQARWGCQWNIALTAGNAEGRYFDIQGSPGLGTPGSLGGAGEFGLVDEWIGLDARFRAEPGVALSFHPVETVSLSEAGYERLYQGTALLFTWPIALEPGAEWEAKISFEIQERPRPL